MTKRADLLAKINQNTWQRLDQAVLTRGDPFRFISLSTVDESGLPQCRLLVLRGIDLNRATMVFHTDVRSPKWRELKAGSSLALLGYDPQEEIQIRFSGRAVLHEPKSEINQSAWRKLSVWTQAAYCGGPPGDVLTHWSPSSGLQTLPGETGTAPGRERFGVIVFETQKLDWFRHRREKILRALFEYAGSTVPVSANWITP